MLAGSGITDKLITKNEEMDSLELSEHSLLKDKLRSHLLHHLIPEFHQEQLVEDLAEFVLNQLETGENVPAGLELPAH